MPNTKMILKCSASDTKKFTKAFGDLVAPFCETKEIEATYPCSMPLFRCTDMVRVAGIRGLQQVVSYATKMYSPANHVRIATIYGDSKEDIENTVNSLRQIEDLSVG